MQSKAVVWKETTVPNASLHADHTLKTKHTVGQVVHNVHKIFRVLEKSNYLKRFGGGAEPPKPSQGQGGAGAQQTQSNPLQGLLETGCPQTYGRIMKYLAFESSTAFTNFLRAKQVNLQIQYLIEAKFIKEM